MAVQMGQPEREKRDDWEVYDLNPVGRINEPSDHGAVVFE